MNLALILAAAAVTLFGDKPVTEKLALPADVRTNAFVLSFDATFPKGAPRSFRLNQYFPHDKLPTQHACLDTDLSFPGYTRTFNGIVHYGKKTCVPWFSPNLVNTHVADGETRRVKVVSYAGAMSFYLEYGGKMYRTHVVWPYPNFRLEALSFAKLSGKDCSSVRISNVRLKPLGPGGLPRPRDGFLLAECPKTLTIPVEGDETHFQFVPGGYPVNLEMRFRGSATNVPTLKLDSFHQRVELTAKVKDKLDGQGLPLFQQAKSLGYVLWEDSGLEIKGCENGHTEGLTVFTRTKINQRYRGEQVPAIITNAAAYGECAAGHVFDCRLVKRDGRYRLWIDGEFAREIPARDVSCIEFDVPPFAQLKVFPTGGAGVRSTLVEKLPERPPFAVAACRENLGSWALEYDGYRSRRPYDRMPDCYLRRVPVGTYVKAKVRCRLGGDTNKDTRVTARLANLGMNGSNCGASPDAVTQQTKAIAREPGKDVYEVEFDFDPGQIQDVIWQRGRESLDFEVLGGVMPVSFFAGKQDKPDEQHPSDVVVLGAELLHAPAGMWVENGCIGNLFVIGSEVPHLTAHVEALVAGDYRVSWQVSDIDSRVVETHADAATLADGGRTSFRCAFKTRRPGWYSVVTTLTAADGTPCVTRKSAFVIEPPDTRKAGYESPYFIWTTYLSFGGKTEDERRDRLVDYCRRLGVHRATVRAHSEAYFGDYPLTLDPLPDIISKEPSKEKRLAGYEAKILDYKKRFPHATHATVLHECNGGPLPLEVAGGKTELSEGCRRDDAAITQSAREVVECYRRLWPEMKFAFGNSGDSICIAARLCRGKLEPEYYDYVGEETVGYCSPPEVNIAENFWTLRDGLRRHGYDRTQPCACWEWKSRPRRLFESLRTLAAFNAREALVALAWRSPNVPLSGHAEPDDSYFTTSWSGAIFTRRPLMQPFPGAAAVATLTRALDCCTFRRMVPTGSKTVYCLEFERGDEYVYALWTARGAIGATAVTGARKAVLTDLYGASEDKSRWFSSKVTFEISDEPCYLTVDKPVRSLELERGSRRYPRETYAGMEKAQAFARFDSTNGLRVMSRGEQPNGFAPALWQLPVCRPGVCSLSEVEDEEKGRVVELTLKPTGTLPTPLVKELGYVALKEPIAIPEGTHTLALDVKGNSCWGRVSAQIVDARGGKFVFAGRGGDLYFDLPCAVALNFDGWCRLHFPLDAQSPVKNHSHHSHELQWKGPGMPVPPLKLVGFGATLKRQTLNLVEMEDVDTLSIRFAGAVAY